MLSMGKCDAVAAKVASLSSAQAPFPPRASARHHREPAMLTITGLNCLYDTSSRGWAMEIAFADDKATRRFDLDSADDAEMLIEAFEESSTASFDPESGEIRFAFEYAAAEEDEEDEESAEDETDEDKDKVAGDESEEDENEDDNEPKRKSA
jgi:hypothetical protein